MSKTVTVPLRRKIRRPDGSPGTLAMLVACSVWSASPRVEAATGLSVREAVETEWYVEPSMNLVITGPSAGGATFPFSPDGKRSFYVTRKADVASDQTSYQLYVVERVVSDAQLRVRKLATMKSRSNHPGISQVAWVDDNRVAFVADDTGGTPQIYSVSMTGVLTRHTADQYDKAGFAFGPKGMVVYGVVTPFGRSNHDDNDGYVVGTRTLSEVLNLAGVDWRRRISYRMVTNTSSTVLPGLDAPFSAFPPFISISPSGRYVALATAPERVPQSWDKMTYVMKYPAGSMSHSYHQVLKLVDTADGRVYDVGGGPIAHPTNPTQLVWDEAKERLIALDQFVTCRPPGVDNDLSTPWTFEYSLRDKKIVRLIAASSVPTGSSRDDTAAAAALANNHLQILRRRSTQSYFYNGVDWRRDAEKSPYPRGPAPFSLEIDQAFDRQPQLMATNSASSLKTAVGPILNSETRDKMIPAQLYQWTDKEGKAWEGGLILPPGRKTGERLPLIIQGHTFRPTEFIVNGTYGSSAGFAAQAYARAGFAVITTGYRKNESYGPDEFKIAAEGYRSLIADLSAKGLIDKDRVGVVAWSRSGFWLQHALAFEDNLFAAAYAADVSSFGLYTYLFFQNWGGYQDDFITENGTPPFGKGRQIWLEKDPVTRGNPFNVPLHIDKYGASMPSWWETYSAMTTAKKPVEYLHIPTSVHNPVIPRHQVLIQSTAVDWFRFWLKGEVNERPEMPDQNRRWADLCKLRIASAKSNDAASRYCQEALRKIRQ